MRLKPLFFVLLLAGCATVGVGNWQYRVTDYSGYSSVNPAELSALIRRAEEDFRASPAYPGDGVRQIAVIRAGRRPDGRILIEFSTGDSDSTAIYLFDSGGRIVDRHLRSFWDPVISTPAASPELEGPAHPPEILSIVRLPEYQPGLRDQLAEPSSRQLREIRSQLNRMQQGSR